MSGKFITIEGTDGAGKSTQIKMLVEYLDKKGFDVIVTREPGGTKIGEKIREIILDKENAEMDCVTEAFLYAASRAQHVKEKIIPALKEGKIVICDRFVDSSIVYQGYARGISIDFIEKINRYATEETVPDLTLFFDIVPYIGIERKKAGQDLDRIEKENIDFHMAVYEGYKKVCSENSERIKRINALKSVEDVHSEVILAVETLFS